MAKDPVCGMEVDEQRAEHKTEYKRKVYFFCSAHCKMTFEREPDKYVE